METTLTSAYLMGHTSAEYQRLRVQAAVWEASTVRALDAIGIQQGMNCLDAGCGPGEVMRLLGSRVGPAGHVTGIDVDSTVGEEALRVLTATAGRQFSFHAMDLETATGFPNAPYDLVYARLVLIHLKNPVDALRRLWACVKPGGTLLIQDYDMSFMHMYPTTWAFGEFKNVLLRTFEAGGKDYRIGSRMPQLFVEAGIGPPTGTDVYGIIDQLQRIHPMLTAVYQSLLPIALQAGVTNQEQSERFFRELPQQANDGDYYTGAWPLMIATWKQKA
ncbi:class I SAM-dependent methyltransferase [Spirosoma arcticum]